MFGLTKVGISRLSSKSILSVTTCLKKSPLRKLSQFQLFKITKKFDSFYDRNGDGVVCKDDIDGLKQTMREYCVQTQGQTPERKTESLVVGFDDYMHILQELADSNHDGKISLEEWVNLWKEMSQHAQDWENFPQWAKILPASIFPLVDTKGDGVIDLDEYKNFWYHVGAHDFVDELTLQDIYSQMTENGSKHLTQPHFQHLYALYFLSDDTSCPSKYIAGPTKFPDTFK